MSCTRIASMVLLVIAACSESDMASDSEPDALGLVVEAAEELLAGLPPLCTTLRTEGYETGKVAVDDASDTHRRLADEACPDDLQELADGRAVERAAAELSGADIDIRFDRCAATRTGFEAAVTITNDGPTSVGVYATVRPTSGDTPAGVGDVAVAWRLAPGVSVTREVSGTGSGDGCAVEFNVFLSDPDLGGDGSGPSPSSPELAADDAAVWLAALVETELTWLAERDIDGPARTEDLRSTAYTDLVAAVREGRTEAPAVDGVSVCSVAPRTDSPRLATVVARLGDTVVAGVVRRGHDDGWRWLGTTLTLGTGPCPS